MRKKQAAGYVIDILQSYFSIFFVLINVLEQIYGTVGAKRHLFFYASIF
jgi:hypothetical protein